MQEKGDCITASNSEKAVSGKTDMSVESEENEPKVTYINSEVHGITFCVV